MVEPRVLPGQSLPLYRVIARNGATRSDNRIHSDDVARSLGFRGGLVPGITTFGYMTRPVIEALGLGWIDRGRASIRLQRPVYEGEAIEVSGTVTAADREGVTIELVVAGEGEIKATGAATLLAAPPPPIDLSAWPREPLPAAPRPGSRAGLEGVSVLGTLEARFDAGAATPEIDDSPPIYREAEIAPPALLLAYANWVFAANVALGPWVHLASEVELRGRVRDGDAISTRAKIERLFEKKGRELVDLDVLVVANLRDAVMRVKHTAIYRL